MQITGILDRCFYPSVRPNWDDELLRARIRVHLEDPQEIVLDLGAGSGRVSQMNFKGVARKCYGIDLDPLISRNPHLDAACLGTAERLPFRDESFDVVFADNVLEHLDRPQVVFREIARVLRPNGVFLVKTPNARHYVALAARLTPLWFHAWVNERRGRASADTFPTVYRANTAGSLRRLARAASLATESIEIVEGRPEYCRIHPLAYLLGVAYERTVNLTSWLEGFRLVLMARFRKPPR